MYSAIAVIIAAIMPLTYFLLTSSNIRIVGDYTQTTQLAVGARLYIMMPVNNTLTSDLNATYVTEVVDKNGYTDSIRSINFTAPSSHVVYPNNVWFPLDAGNYTINGLVLTSLDKPALVAEPEKANVTIVGVNSRFHYSLTNSSFDSMFDSYSQSETYYLDTSALSRNDSGANSAYNEIESDISSCQRASISLGYGLGSMNIALAGMQKDSSICSLAVTYEIEMGRANFICSVPIETMREWHSWNGGMAPSIQEISSYCAKVA